MKDGNNFKEIIGRAMTDEDFLNEFLSDPVKASSDYNLSEEEKTALKAINCEELSKIGTELTERISKSFIDLSTLLACEGDVGHTSSHTNTHASTHSKNSPDEGS
ncbi:MAG: Os1348 family NHLP clan protein [Candidatus Omnitrophota bacterium]